MTILHTGDWHADKSTAGVPRFADVERAAWQTVEAAIFHRVSLYCFTGDLADPDSGPVVIRCIDLAQRVAEALLMSGIPSWWVAGNHDVAEDGSGTTMLSPLRSNRAAGAIRVFESPELVALPDGTSGIALPFPALARTYDPAKFIAQVGPLEGRRVFVAGHMTRLEGIPDGEETLEMPRGKGIGFPLEQCGESWLLMNGHWHDRQEYRRAGRTVHVCGALARFTFGEEKNRPSFNLYEF